MPLTYLFLEFDGTIIEHDTIASLASIRYQVHSTQLPALPSWSHFTEAYVEDSRAYEQYHPRREGESITLKAEIEYLNGMRDAELRVLGGLRRREYVLG